ncbi:MAG: ATPase, T2SS/T4P/T4SS family [Minisyncoccia bacterium]
MHIDEKQLIDFAFDSGLVSKSELEQAQNEAEKTGLSLGDVLVKDGFINDDDLRRIYAQISGISFVDLRQKDLRLDVLNAIPESTSRKHNIIAYVETGGDIEVAFLSVDDLKYVDFLKTDKGMRVLPRFTDKESIKIALTTYQKLLKKEFGEKIQKETAKISKSIEKMGDEDSSSTNLKSLAEEESVARVGDLILKHAIYQDATDIHIEPQNTETIIRFRINGTLREAFSLPQNVHLPIALRFKFLAGLDLDNSSEPQDGRFKMEIEKGIDSEKKSFRVSTIPTHSGEKITLRVLQTGVLGFTLETLGFHGEGLEVIHNALKNSGALIAAGIEGTGKTTTLYTILDILNKPSVSIATLESPIEYQMNRIMQIEIKPDTGLSFANGFRAILKQDPDVVMIGELKEEDLAVLALNAAISGKLILAPVKSKTAGKVFEELTNLGIERFLLSSSVKVVMGHALVKKISDKKEEYALSKEDLSKLNKIADLEKVLTALKQEKIVNNSATWQTIKCFKPLEDTEYVIGVHEVLKITPTIKDLILDGATGREIESQAIREGMLTLVEDALFKAVSGATTLEEVFRLSEE